MTDEINTGGPAFARSCGKTPHSSNHAQDGMTLRDYFAAKAMQGALNESMEWCEDDNHMDCIARFSYMVADAMIAARGGVK